MFTKKLLVKRFLFGTKNISVGYSCLVLYAILRYFFELGAFRDSSTETYLSFYCATWTFFVIGLVLVVRELYLFAIDFMAWRKLRRKRLESRLGTAYSRLKKGLARLRNWEESGQAFLSVVLDLLERGSSLKEINSFLMKKETKAESVLEVYVYVGYVRLAHELRTDARLMLRQGGRLDYLELW